jgi:hypothetical protein
LPSCLAFSAAVIKGEKKPSACPFIGRKVLDELPGEIDTREPYEKKREEELKRLQGKIVQTDLKARADRLGGKIIGGNRLVIQCLGKDFSVSQNGVVASECHTHTGLTIPLLTYILHPGEQVPPQTHHEWVSFGELTNGAAMAPLFQQRCENTLKKIADAHPELFEDLVSIFSAKKSENHFSSDVSVVLLPLPRIPVMICYWQPEDNMDSMLRIFFDSAAENFLAAQSIYALVVGLVMMFEKIVVKHT